MVGAHSRSGNADRPELTDVPDDPPEPVSGRGATEAAWQAHAAALELQGSVTRHAQERARAGRRQSRRWAWLVVIVCLIAVVVTVDAYGWQLGS